MHGEKHKTFNIHSKKSYTSRNCQVEKNSSSTVQIHGDRNRNWIRQSTRNIATTHCVKFRSYRIRNYRAQGFFRVSPKKKTEISSMYKRPVFGPEIVYMVQKNYIWIHRICSKIEIRYLLRALFLPMTSEIISSIKLPNKERSFERVK